MRKTRKASSLMLSVRLPGKQVREKFLIIYELEGCQRAVNFLTEYYGVRKMRIMLDGRRVGRGCVASYFTNRAYFTKEGLRRCIVLHELYHHLVDSKGYELSSSMEEKEADGYARAFLRAG